jgi:phage I-like protein
MPNSRAKRPLIAVCALAVRPGDELVRLIPAGEFDAPRGAFSGSGPWRLPEAAARRVMMRAAARSTHIPIDYEHQTLMVERNGQPAPAAGWVDPATLTWRADGEEPGLYGHVRWTERAAAAIAGDEYRYLSPVFPYDPETGEVLDLLHLALTNTPAIDSGEITARAAARMSIIESQEDDTVKREQLIELLGLAADATDEQITAALTAGREARTALAALRTELGVDEKGDPKTAIAALKAAKPAEPDLSQYVPKAVFDEQAAQLAALKASGDTAEIDRLIEEGLADGRIAGEATATWLREQGLAALKSHLADAPSIAALKATQTRGKAPEGDKGDGELTEAELAVCRNMGLDPKAYKEAN